ncbi:hypothetical protein ASG61_23070 [Bacillus sp. Leaf75]|nr:hypothetical protein ASG61_23070 [Bacillus sp. Leaf75]
MSREGNFAKKSNKLYYYYEFINYDRGVWMKVSKRAVAFLDILGFKNMLLTTPLDELSAKYENLAEIANLMNRPLSSNSQETPSLFPNHLPNQRWCYKNIFSDSIILVSEDESEESVTKLLIYCWKLMQAAISLKMPFRGGIAYDDFYINEESNIFLGKALTDAYALETKQQWIGVSIDDGLINAFPNLSDAFKREGSLVSLLFPRYLVPYKNGEKVEHHVLNWRINFVSKEGTKALLGSSSNADAQQKIDNTLEFAKSVVQSEKVYLNDEAVPVELRAFYVGDTPPPFPHGDEF